MADFIGGIIMWIVLILLIIGYFIAKKFGHKMKNKSR
jgi:hypothetical protein